MSRESFMRRAIALANESMRAGNGGPFGAVVVRDGKIVGEGTNRVTSANDPTAHAEIVAIREACGALEDFSLPGTEIYTSCEPCPMCLAAIYWARIDRIYYANTRVDAAGIGFDDDHIYREIGLDPGDRAVPLVRLLADEAKPSFDEWRGMENKIAY